ncbi:hypothetical protein [Macellibacteroides fermentans]|jgi:ferritin-like protein|uniref:Ferritin-like protein n=1 Tax=Macellibacteroides fermentans TaxID=879969 RepID=A0A8E1ZZN7_9PORP|nr:hypothetical protein [Macellibacteroides fermentans]NYI50670.1 ferritin-like protein [Macellibacteroides fermentans]
MELTKEEQVLWNNFKEVVMSELEKQFTNNNMEVDFFIMESMIDTTVDLYAYTYSNVPVNGISEERVKQLIFAEASLIKRKVKEMLFG